MNIRTIIVWICCIFLICNAIFSLTGTSYIPTHDGEYHIIRFVEFSKMLHAGYLFPRWAPDLNSRYGLPIFQYHYPLPNYIGSAIRLITHDAVYAFQWSLILAYFAVIAGLFYWLTAVYSIPIALFGAVIGSYTPYLFLDIYVRGVIGEVWAIALFGFILGNIERKRYLLASVCFALLILSHNISAMVFGIYVCCYAMYRHRNIYFLAIGALLASYFWIPAIFEQKYVVGLNTVNFRDHFVQLYEFLIPSWGTQFSATGTLGNKMSFQFGIIPFIISVLVIIGSIREKNTIIASLLRFLSFTLFALILLFPISIPIWNILSPLQFVQYPWRFLSLAIPITAFGVSYSMDKRKSFILYLILAVGVFGLTWRYVRPVQYQPRNESYYLSKPNFTDGTSSMGNSFSTVWSVWKEMRPDTFVSISNGSLSKTFVQKYLYISIQVSMIQNGIVRFNTLYFPGWNAYIDGTKAQIEYKKDGVISIRVPEGIHTITVRFTETPVRWFADILSIASLIGILGWGILSLRNPKHTVN